MLPWCCECQWGVTRSWLFKAAWAQVQCWEHLHAAEQVTAGKYYILTFLRGCGA